MTFERNTTDPLMEMLESGSKFVLEHKNRQAIKAIIRLCKKHELEAVLALQKRVADDIADKKSFVMSTMEEIADSLESDVCIGAFHDGRLIAFTLMIISPHSMRNLGRCLRYTQEQCAKAVTYDTTFIDPAYRGYGLQRLFVKLKDRLAGNLGATEVLATVAPSNSVSLRNLEASGFSILTRKKMYGDYDRYILRKALTHYVR